MLLQQDVTEVKSRYLTELLTLLHRALSHTSSHHLTLGHHHAQLTHKLTQLRRINKDLRTTCNRLLNCPQLKYVDTHTHTHTHGGT